MPFSTSGLWRSLEEVGSFSAQQRDEKKDAHHVQTGARVIEMEGKAHIKH